MNCNYITLNQYKVSLFSQRIWSLCSYKLKQNCCTYRARRGYWENINPSSGRPFSSSMSKPDNWGVTQGDKDLIQHKEITTQEEMDSVINRATHKEEVVNGSN